MLDEPPERSVLVADRAFHKRIAHHSSRGQQVGPLRAVRGVLRAVKEDVADSCRAAAATVVVPEARAEPLRHSGVEDRPETPSAQVAHPDAADVGDAAEQ